MASVSDIVARVQRRVIDLPTNVATETQTLVEEAHRNLQELHNFKVMEAVASKTTTLNDATLGTIGTDLFKDYRGLPWYTDDLGVTYHFRAISHSEGDVLRDFRNDADRDVGRPYVLLHKPPDTVGASYSGHQWEVYPIPDGLANTTDGEYVVKIPYWQYLATPTTSDWFTDNATEFLVDAATAQAFALNWDEAKYLIWRTKAFGPQWDARNVMGGELLRVVQRDKKFRFSSVEGLVPHMDVHGSRLGL